MLDQRIINAVATDAQKAMHGDQEAHNHLRLELNGLSQNDLKALATELQSRFGKTDTKYLPGVMLETDTANEITALSFEPTLYDRLKNNAVGVENTLAPIGNVGASANFFREIRQDYDKLPAKIRNFVERNPIEFTAAGLTPEADQSLKGTPRGYPKGETYDAARGATEVGSGSSHQQVIMAEYYKNLGEAPQKSDDVENTFLHEVGHVVDSRMGDISDDLPRPDGKSFSQAYAADVAKMPADIRKNLEYFLQPGAAGKSEAFAECFSIVEGATPDTRALFDKYFSKSEQAVRTALQERGLS